MEKFNIYKAKTASSHNSMNDNISMVAAEIFWILYGKRDKSINFRAAIENSMNETFEAAIGDYMGSIHLDDESMVEWISVHKNIVNVIDNIEKIHEEANSACHKAIQTINSYRYDFIGGEDFYKDVDHYESPRRSEWIPMEKTYRNLLQRRYKSIYA